MSCIDLGTRGEFIISEREFTKMFLEIREGFLFAHNK